MPTLLLDVLAIGLAASFATLQTRAMDVAGDAQARAAALERLAFNVANAIGPLLGGIAIAAGAAGRPPAMLGAPWHFWAWEPGV